MNRSEAIALLKKANQYLKDEDFTVAAEEMPQIEKWVEELRSGKYPQAEESLFSYEYDDYGKRTGEDKGYCCLGVYCAAVHGATKKALDGESFPGDIELAFPLSFLVQQALANLNDGNQQVGKHTFSQIADIVEAVWLGGENEVNKRFIKRLIKSIFMKPVSSVPERGPVAHYINGQQTDFMGNYL